MQLCPTILYTIVSNNGELTILDEHTYWILEDQVRQLLSLGLVGVLVRIYQCVLLDFYSLEKNIINYSRLLLLRNKYFLKFGFLQTMAKVGLSMVRSFGLPLTMEYFLNGLFNGVSQDCGKTTMENLCNSISMGDKDLFEQTLTNNGSFQASLSFPVGRTYTDVDSAWGAVMGITIDLNGDIKSSGFFTAVPAHLRLPFTDEEIDPGKETQYSSCIIRMEFSEPSIQRDTSTLIQPSQSTLSRTKQSHILKSVEFFFDF